MLIRLPIIKCKTDKSRIIDEHPEYLVATSFLADIYMRDGNKTMALKLYSDALTVDGISAQDKAAIQQMIMSLNQSE